MYAQASRRLHEQRPRDGAGAVIAANAGWGNSLAVGPSALASGAQAATANLFAQVGAFPLSIASGDDAMLATLPPGAYTVQVAGSNSSSGLALTELYDAGSAVPHAESTTP